MTQEISTRRRWTKLELLPLLLIAIAGFTIFFWPTPTVDVSPLYKPPVSGPGAAAPETIVSVAQGQPVGNEAYWDGFRLNSGWHMAPDGKSGRYMLVADVTNTSDVPDVASVLVTIRVGERDLDLLACNASIGPAQTRPLLCADTGHSQFTSRWGRITISAV
jgi:hypothetical protein